MRREEKTVFIDGTDWQHEVDANMRGTKVYPSLKNMKKFINHDVEGCGVVRCKLVFDGWVIPQDTKKMMADAIPASEMTQLQIEDCKKRIEKDQAFLKKLEDSLKS